jgi:hypothetical protein
VAPCGRAGDEQHKRREERRDPPSRRHRRQRTSQPPRIQAMPGQRSSAVRRCSQTSHAAPSFVWHRARTFTTATNR